MMTDLILPLIALLFAAMFAVHALARSPKWRLQSGLDLLLEGGDALALMVAGRMIIPWSQVSPWWWLALVAPLTFGVAGLVLNWRLAPLFRSTRSVSRSLVWAGVHLLVWTAILVLVLG